MVACRGGSLDSSTWHLANELREKFQQHLLERLNAFAAWQEPDGDPYKLQLNKFRDIEYVFEAAHQHFIRNHSRILLVKISA
ncbi:uncharacterized protein IUM83_00573 [Phytophthora cinnamomi]|uniref:uncharacterized protein n=1 Tax=Phytophthora cinnamomi TaxID=4785 RepID=UPI00355AC4C8|nr:hypothetical protein IUM83_00573 [Phytophthora cinnamomi]